MRSGSPFKLGLIGSPVKHSLSQLMQEAALRTLSLEGSYALLDVPSEDLARTLRESIEDGYRGLNVTVPHKRAVYEWAAHHRVLDDEARLVGAVNTLVFDPENRAPTSATNTDARGLEAALSAARVQGRPALVLGAGGAARAALVALARLGASRIEIRARDSDSAKRLLLDVRASWTGSEEMPPTHFGSLEDLPVAEVPCTVIQATSAELASTSSFLDAFPFRAFGKEALFVDLAYRRGPAEVLGETRFLHAARAHGFPTQTGLAMLLEQGFLALEHWLPSATIDARVRLAMQHALLLGASSAPPR